MRHWLGCVRLISAAVLVAAYAASAIAAAPALEARQDVPRRGLLYEIRTGANTVYLFGTLQWFWIGGGIGALLEKFWAGLKTGDEEDEEWF